MAELFFYKCICNKVIDGDTIEALIDLGFGMFIKKIIRLARIDTPEKNSKDELEKRASLKVKAYVTDLMLNKEFYISTKKLKFDKYDRYLGEVYRQKDDKESLSDTLINKKFCRLYDGSKKIPWLEDELKIILGDDIK